MPDEPIGRTPQEDDAPSGDRPPRIGVYVCHCGGNISDVVDVDRVADEIGRLPGVDIARHVMFMCSDEGQSAITDDIAERGLDRVIVAACTPKLHETTFRRVLVRGGLNPYLFLPANVREQVSWAHPHEPEAATEKAIRIVRAAVAKAQLLKPLENVRVDAVHRALVVGGGVAGLRAALDLARSGVEVDLVERSPFLGGRAAQLHRVYPTDEAARPLVDRLVRDVVAEPRIVVRTGTEIAGLTGYVGDFAVTLRATPRGVSPHLVGAAAAAATAACPVQVSDEFNYGIGTRRAIYHPYAGAWPPHPAIDWAACTRCGDCDRAAREAGAVDAIRLDGVPEETTIEVGAIVAATGFDHYEPRAGEYGYATLPGVVTLPQLHRILDPDGPTGGRLERDGRPVRSVAFIHCVGSRQIDGIDEPGRSGRLNEYCSRVCCTATLQAAGEIRERFPDVRVVDVYRDIRTYQKDQEDYYVNASERGVLFVRFDQETRPVVEAAPPGETSPLLVRVRDTLTFGRELEIPVDLVVLAVGMEPRDISGLVELTKAPVGSDGFLLEVHPKLRPVESAIPGLLLAGTAQAPMDITEATSAASAAVAKVATLLAHDFVEMEPFVAKVNPARCTGTGACLDACRYAGAIALQEVEVEEGVFVRRAYINPVACKGCGACVPVCPTAAIDVQAWEIDQFRAMIDAICADPAPPEAVPAGGARR